MRGYNFNKNLKGYQGIIDFFKKIEDQTELIGKILILPDNYEEYIDKEKTKWLTKPVYGYKNDIYDKVYTKTEYQNYLKKMELEKIRKEQKQQKINENETKMVEEIKKKYGNRFRDEKWIIDNIGEYYTYEIILPYFWTIIGDNYIRLKNGNIRLQKDIQDQIKQINKKELGIGISGTQFLGRRFCYNGKSHCIEFERPYLTKKEEKKFEDFKTEINYGIYGIYKGDELFYIGSTMRDFSLRFNEHLENIKNHSNELALYSLISINDDIGFAPLINVKDLKSDRKIERHDLECMELALIHLYQPKGNMAGRICDVNFKE